MTRKDSHPLGRFVVRVVPPGEPLYAGITRDFTRSPESWEAGHLILEIYDTRYAGSELGQFVCAYGADTIAAMNRGGRLSLHSGIPEWMLTAAETAALVALAEACLAKTT
jgi:hypothetical protein